MKFILSFIFVILTFLQTGYSQWVDMMPPQITGEPMQLTIQGEYLYSALRAGSSGVGGIAYTTNDGVSWTDISGGLTNTSVLSFTANEQILFAGTENGVFRSTDNGSFWTATGGGLTNPYVYSVYYDSTILFAGTGAGVFRSTDLGETWDTSSTGLPFASVFSFLKWNEMFLIGTSAGAYRSSDYGMTWEGPSSGMDYGYVGDFATNGNNIFVILAGLSYGSVYRSIDDGASWTLVSSSFPQTGYVNALISYNSEVFASVGGKVLYSTDLGTTWTDMSEGLQNHLVTALVTDGTEIYLRVCKIDVAKVIIRSPCS